MAYTPTNVFTGGTPVRANQLQQNTDGLRRYINREIVQADIDDNSVTTTDIVRGEYVQVVSDHLFTTGDMMTAFNEVDFYNRNYYTSHFKQYDLYSNKMMQVPNMGRRVVMEHDGHIVFTVSVSARGDANYQLIGEKRENPVYVQISLNDRVLSTDYKPATKGRAFNEDDIGTDVSNSGNTTTNGDFSRRWYCNRYYYAANKGDVVNICLVVDPKGDRMWSSAANMNVEVFYR